MRRAQLDCKGDASQVAVARRFVRATLTGWAADQYDWTAEALVSELATNAVIHARTDFRVVLTLDDTCLRLEVADDSPLPPVRRRFESTATTGRGMRLVEDLSSSWSVVVDGGSKVVACVIALADAGGRLPSDAEAVVDIAALLADFDADEHDGGHGIKHSAWTRHADTRAAA